MSADPPSDPAELLAGVRDFVSATVLPNVVDWDREDRLPATALQTMLDLGLPGALVPSRYGGRGFSVLDMVPVWRTLSQGWISLAGAIDPSALRRRCCCATGPRNSDGGGCRGWPRARSRPPSRSPSRRPEVT
jgi:hypothetical protein